MEGSPETLGVDKLYDTLSNERRRACLQYLAENEGAVGVDDLATSIAEDAATDDLESVKQSTYISLIQSHLPKLDDYGVVEYDADTKTVLPGPAFGQVYGCLRSHGHGEDRFGRHRRFLAITGVTILGLLFALVVTDARAYVLFGLVVINVVAMVANRW